MTKLLIISVAIIMLVSSAKADTIDYWHVSYNKLKIQEFNQNLKGEILLKIDDIKQADSLMVKYYRDTPCEYCEIQVTIENRNHLVITKSKGRGTFNPISFSVFDLIQNQFYSRKEIFEVFYSEEPLKGRSDRILLFKIQFE